MPEAWGGFSNGQIPLAELRVLRNATYNGQPTTAFRLRADASLALDRLLAQAEQDGYDTDITDAYRDYETQVRLKAEKGVYAATPGTSNHGLAMAGDLAYYASSKSFGRWMWANRALALENGWYPPAWTHDGQGIEEPWHWEYDDALDQHRNEEAAAIRSGGIMYVCKKDDRGDAVEMLQETLRDLGQRIEVDGAFGPATEAALSAEMGWDKAGYVNVRRCRAIENKLMRQIADARISRHARSPHGGADGHSHTATVELS